MLWLNELYLSTILSLLIGEWMEYKTKSLGTPLCFLILTDSSFISCPPINLKQKFLADHEIFHQGYQRYT